MVIKLPKVNWASLRKGLARFFLVASIELVVLFAVASWNVREQVGRYQVITFGSGEIVVFDSATGAAVQVRPPDEAPVLVPPPPSREL